MDASPRQVATVIAWVIIYCFAVGGLATATVGLLPLTPALFATAVVVKQLRLENSLRREMRSWLTTGK